VKRARPLIVLTLIGCLAGGCASRPSTADKLREWQHGVWVSTGGVYTVWTDSHYFVVSATGDSTKANIYCGSSRIRFTDKGVARHQNLRLRQTPDSAMLVHGDYSMYFEGENGGVEEAPLEIDLDQFKPGTCNVVEGVIYDSVSEETPEYILLSSCNGDQIKLFRNGRSLYRSADGYEAWSYRIESW